MYIGVTTKLVDSLIHLMKLDQFYSRDVCTSDACERGATMRVSRCISIVQLTIKEEEKKYKERYTHVHIHT